MRKSVWLLIAVILTVSVLPGAVPAAHAEEQELTILAYICGADLESDEGEASGDIREMISSMDFFRSGSTSSLFWIACAP